MIKRNMLLLMLFLSFLNLYSQSLEQLKIDIQTCNQEFLQLNSEYKQIQKEYLTSLKEISNGQFCSECLRSASQIEKDENESFQVHLSRVKGHVVYDDALNQEATANAMEKYSTLLKEKQQQIDQKKIECDELKQYALDSLEQQDKQNNIQIQDADTDEDEEYFTYENIQYTAEEIDELVDEIYNNLNETQQQQNYINQTNPDYLDDNYDANIAYHQNNANSVNNDDVASNVFGSDVNDDNPYNRKITMVTLTPPKWADDASQDWDPMQTVNENSGVEEIDDDNSNWENDEYGGWDEDIDQINDEIEEHNIKTIDADNQNVTEVQVQNVDNYQNTINDQIQNSSVENITEYGNNIQKQNTNVYSNFNHNFIQKPDSEDETDNYNEQEDNVAVSVSNDEKSYYEQSKEYMSKKWNNLTNTVSKFPKSLAGFYESAKMTANLMIPAIDVGANPNATEQDYNDIEEKSNKITNKIARDNCGFSFN